MTGKKYPYVYVDGIYLRRNWGGEYENAAIRVAIAVNQDGFREVIGAAEGIVGDKCFGMLEAVVHFYRNIFSTVPRSKVRLVAKMPKAIHAQESKKAAREKAAAIVAELQGMKLKEAAKKVSESIDETLTYYDFPSEHWMKIWTNNTIEGLNREIRHRTRVVGTFPDGNSALMPVCARLRYVAG